MLSSYADNLSAKLAITAPTISPHNHTSFYQGETHTTWSVQIGHHKVPSHVYESNSHANDMSLAHISSPTRPHISMSLTRRASGTGDCGVYSHCDKSEYCGGNSSLAVFVKVE